MRTGRATVVSLTLLVLIGGTRRSEAQFEPPRVFGGAIAASWIAPPDTPGNAYGVFHFRRTLELPSRPERFTVHVSGDSRYRLFVNGLQVSSGPQRSDLMYWRYETVDLAPHLREGRNVLAALRKAGLPDRYVERLAPWQEMLALGLTTTAESPEPTRSDSHASSAHPNYGLLATVLGIRPAKPGFRSVVIAPSLGPLKRAEGRMPHPLGDIAVRLLRVGAQGVRAEITLPPGLEGVFQWGSREKPLRPGRQEIEL